MPTSRSRRPDGPVVGLAGTVSTLVCLDRGITVYDRARVHHAVLSRRRTSSGGCDTLSSEDARARLARPGMVEGREDVIVGGVLVLAVGDGVFRTRPVPRVGRRHPRRPGGGPAGPVQRSGAVSPVRGAAMSPSRPPVPSALH